MFPKTTPPCAETSAVNSDRHVIRARLEALSSNTTLHRSAIDATGSPNESKMIASCARNLEFTEQNRTT